MEKKTTPPPKKHFSIPSKTLDEQLEILNQKGQFLQMQNQTLTRQLQENQKELYANNGAAAAIRFLLQPKDETEEKD